MEKDELKIFLFASIISADNDDFTEAQKQQVIARYDKSNGIENSDWDYILEPIKDTEHYKTYLELFKDE